MGRGPCVYAFTSYMARQGIFDERIMQLRIKRMLLLHVNVPFWGKRRPVHRVFLWRHAVAFACACCITWRAKGFMIDASLICVFSGRRARAGMFLSGVRDAALRIGVF